MTITEITALRKSGHLLEALEAAENEVNNNANKFTAGALFWCLNDLAKQQKGDEITATAERMKSLYSEYCAGDELMQKTLSSISRKAKPHFQELKDAINSAKSGINIINTYQALTKIFNAGELDDDLYPEYGWLTYYALKQTDISDTSNRKVMLSIYLNLKLPKPSILHSLILDEAIKIEHTAPSQLRFRDFIKLWGLENFRDEDWQQYRNSNGDSLPSTVERLISVYAKELKIDQVEAPEEFGNLVDKALEKYPKNQNLPYYKATVLISQGKKDGALSYYKDLILRFPSKYYLWHQASELINDTDTKIGLLCKALTCGADDSFIGGVRLKLATLLVHNDMKPNAKYELEKYRQTYQTKGWHLKSEFWQIYNQVSSEKPAEDNDTVYSQFATKADDFIYSSLPTALAVKISESQKEDRNHQGRKITSWILRTEKNTIMLRKPNKFGLPKHTPNGKPFDIIVKDGIIVRIKEHIGPISASWLKEVGGEVKIRIDRNGREYAIIDGSYISESLLKGINDGQYINILSVKQIDGRWKALAVLK